MNVIIKDMKMPKSCDSCDLIQFDDEELEAHCPLSPYYRWCGTPPDYRPEGCLLVEVPTPHGTLIDKEVAIETFKEVYCGHCKKEIPCFVCSVPIALDVLNDIPTIIEAEVSE